MDQDKNAENMELAMSAGAEEAVANAVTTHSADAEIQRFAARERRITVREEAPSFGPGPHTEIQCFAMHLLVFLGTSRMFVSIGGFGPRLQRVLSPEARRERDEYWRQENARGFYANEYSGLY